MKEAEVCIESDDPQRGIKLLNDLFDKGYRIESINIDTVDPEMIEADITIITIKKISHEERTHT